MSKELVAENLANEKLDCTGSFNVGVNFADDASAGTQLNQTKISMSTTSAYNSSLSDGTRGAGNSQYFAAGLIAHQWNNNGMYYEESFRTGRLKTRACSHYCARCCW